MGYRNRWLVVIAILVGLALVGCGPRGGGEESSNDPASVESVEGSDVGRVTLTQEAADRIGLKTEQVQPVSAVGSSRSSQTVVPLAAVIYDKDGVSWVYINPKPLTFVRERIAIDRVDGDRVILRSGPAPGTAVVTIGAAELLGTEYVVEGE